MLQEQGPMIRPIDISQQVDWMDLEGCVIIGLKKKGEKNTIHMSSLTVEQLAYLSHQLQAHTTFLLGTLEEK